MKIGSDPELFLKDVNGKIVSAIGLLGGTKKAPRPVPQLGKGFSIQEDNVLAEYNTPPATNADQFIEYQRKIQEYLKNEVGQHGLTISDKASHSMDPKEMNHPKAWIFGCDPDFNVWTLTVNSKPQCEDELLRSAGGHIHIEFLENNRKKVLLGRQLDWHVGTWLASQDPDKKRMALYGKAGCIRFKPYGIEYRTPSNYWVHQDDNFLKKLFGKIHNAVACAAHGQALGKTQESLVMLAINEKDTHAQEQILEMT